MSRIFCFLMLKYKYELSKTEGWIWVFSTLAKLPGKERISLSCQSSHLCDLLRLLRQEYSSQIKENYLSHGPQQRERVSSVMNTPKNWLILCMWEGINWANSDTYPWRSSSDTWLSCMLWTTLFMVPRLHRNSRTISFSTRSTHQHQDKIFWVFSFFAYKLRIKPLFWIPVMMSGAKILWYQVSWKYCSGTCKDELGYLGGSVCFVTLLTKKDKTIHSW